MTYVPPEIKAARNIGVIKQLIKMMNDSTCECNLCCAIG